MKNVFLILLLAAPASAQDFSGWAWEVTDKLSGNRLEVTYWDQSSPDTTFNGVIAVGAGFTSADIANRVQVWLEQREAAQTAFDSISVGTTGQPARKPPTAPTRDEQARLDMIAKIDAHNDLVGRSKVADATQVEVTASLADLRDEFQANPSLRDLADLIKD